LFGLVHLLLFGRHGGGGDDGKWII
jgi:hypothetical protein